MAERIEKKEFIRRLAERMQTNEATATLWLDGVLAGELPVDQALAELESELTRIKRRNW